MLGLDLHKVARAFGFDGAPQVNININMSGRESAKRKQSADYSNAGKQLYARKQVKHAE